MFSNNFRLRVFEISKLRIVCKILNTISYSNDYNNNRTSITSTSEYTHTFLIIIIQI